MSLFERDKKSLSPSAPPQTKHKWLGKKTILFAHGKDLSASSAIRISRGDSVQVFEVAGDQQRCFLGTFFLIERRENGLVFRTGKNVPKSNLRAWARIRNIPLTLKWERPSNAIQPMRVSMPCRNWIEISRDGSTDPISFVRPKFFLSGRQFTSVRASKANSHIRITPHPIRSGWTIYAPEGHHELIVRHAESGILQSLLIQVEGIKKQRKHATSGNKPHRKQTRQLIIPGWD